MAKPLPGQEPCLPTVLIIQHNLRKHAPILGPFLNTLPRPFSWAFESEDLLQLTSSRSLFSYDISMGRAEECKDEGNKLFNKRDRHGAILAYTTAIDILMNAFRSDPNQKKNRDAEKLLAVCSANRAAAYLLPDSSQTGDMEDLHEAWKDGEVAICTYPSYAKGSIRHIMAVVVNRLTFMLQICTYFHRTPETGKYTESERGDSTWPPTNGSSRRCGTGGSADRTSNRW